MSDDIYVTIAERIPLPRMPDAYDVIVYTSDALTAVQEAEMKLMGWEDRGMDLARKRRKFRRRVEIRP